MASLSNSNLASQGYAPLPLTPCPICGKRLVTDISKAGTRPGIRYYKCEFYSMGQCSFFSWRERYARLLEGNGGQSAIASSSSEPLGSSESEPDTVCHQHDGHPHSVGSTNRDLAGSCITLNYVAICSSPFVANKIHRGREGGCVCGDVCFKLLY